MPKYNKHLDVNLDFLDEDNTSKKKAFSHKPKIANQEISAEKYNWKTLLIIIGFVLFFGWLMFAEDTSNNNNNNNNTRTQSYSTSEKLNNDSVVVGEYTCSRYHYDKAVALNPDESESQMTSDQNSLEYRVNEIDRLQNDMENYYVNEYSSQYEIDQYNEMVAEYNSKLGSYNRDVDKFDSRIDSYNDQSEKHNNYLKSNCTLNR
jgi:peptidoglycan hydrolase CwlO-like protein